MHSVFLLYNFTTVSILRLNFYRIEIRMNQRETIYTATLSVINWSHGYQSTRTFT